MQFNDAMDLLLKSDAEDWRHVNDGVAAETYVFMGDVNLRIETSLEDTDKQADPFVEPWAQSFPDKHAVGWFYRVYYGPTLLHRFVLVSVDGARASLPLPYRGTTQVGAYAYRVAQIVDGGQLNDYMRQVGFTVEPAAKRFWLS
jgi:hypothetical protein